MELAGLSLTEVLSVFGAFGAATAVLYLLKLRRRRVEVPFLDLWSEVLEGERTSRLFSSLRRVLSLLVSLLVVALVAGALGDPRPDAGAPTTTVVVLDTSLSMQAVDVAPSRFEAARAAVREIVASVGANERMLLIRLDARPGPVSPLTNDPVTLRAALDAIEPGDTEGDADRAIEVALDAIEGAARAEVVLVTDGAWSLSDATRERLLERDVAVRAVLVGDPAARANVALTALAARRHPLDPSRAEVLVEVLGAPDAPATIEIVLSSEGRPVDVLPLEVPAGARLRRFFEDVSGLDRTIEARVARTDGADLLPADDHARARLPERRRRRIAVVSDDNAYLEAALLLDELLEVAFVAPGAPLPADLDVTIFDGVSAPSPLPGPTLWLAPAADAAPPGGATGPVPGTERARRPRFDRVDRDHPLVRWVALRDVNVASALVLEPGAGDEVVAGDAGVPLVVAGVRDGAPFVALAFDVRESDLPLRVAWPVLLLNAIDLLAPSDTHAPSGHRAGERMSLPVPRGATRAALSAASGPVIPLAPALGRVEAVVPRAGLYTLLGGDGTSALEPLDVVAVSPAAGTESRLEAARALDLGGGPLAPPPSRPPRAPTAPWQWMILTALLIVALELVTYHRRVSV